MAKIQHMQLRSACAAGGASYVDFSELLSRWPVSRRTAYRAIEQGRLPKPVKISHRKVGWLRDVADAFLENIAKA
jgi:predicted DNA-binding transcriptional regulator AlpA